ncbi:MAG: helix-turn-helix domain-containing protein [Candidatus Delongbacteria bacterium]|nr:helix-turn-helix domain-containing protein [Candidatus Delongbacteria bacterium]
MQDYSERRYLSAAEVAHYLDISVREVHRLITGGELPATSSSSGQWRIDLQDLQELKVEAGPAPPEVATRRLRELNILGTCQRIITGDARSLTELGADEVNLVITSPPYFNAKLYASASSADDLGNMHDLEGWLEQIDQVWCEVMRVLQPGRKFFLNIMNLPVREKGSYHSLNLAGKMIDLCQRIGFVFKRDIVWHKTNGVKAHFGTYPLPGGILLNHMHEFILEFQKPAPTSYRKYKHVSQQERENSRLERDFWLSLKNSDVWLMNPERSGDGRKHVAPFPLELPHRLVKAYSFQGEAVLDPFAGSGTTLVAAAALGRNGVGFEVHDDYARLAEQRLLLLEDG